MAYRTVLIAAAALAVVSMACGVTFNIPMDRIVTGPVVYEDIQIPVPDAEEVELTLNFGAGKLELQGGAKDALVSGEAAYNVADFKPRFSIEGNYVKLETGDLEINGIPRLSDEVRNEWDLKLGETPLLLTINAGAYQGEFDLGGVPLKSLTISDGAADVRLRFSEPNPVVMDTLRYSTGASNLRLSDLANANFEHFIFRSGFGNYTLDFSGQLQRDADVSIQAGASQLKIIAPAGFNVRLTIKGGLTNVETQGEWQGSGDEYRLMGGGPTLTITVEMGAGNLQLLTQQSG
ncbi:MAG: toast rack family protein [Anaerolineales bacterium]|nr:toast rack family protein [Anaerolineales bacterium]